jgi:hypothetical protein
MEEDGLYTDEVCGVYDSEAVPTHAEAGAGHPSSLMIWDWKIQKKKKKKKKIKVKTQNNRMTFKHKEHCIFGLLS